MAFMLIIVEPRGQRATRSEDEGRRLYADMVAYGQGLKERGLLLASESLRPDDHAVRISRASGSGNPPERPGERLERAGEGKIQLLDGPFAEAKEMVGGFFLIDAASRDEAVAIAQACPAVNFATVEVRECAPCYVS